MTSLLTDAALDAILALQFTVAWAGEGRCSPRRLGWWDTDLIDDAGGGDLLARLLPQTHARAAIEAVREASTHREILLGTFQRKKPRDARSLRDLDGAKVLLYQRTRRSRSRGEIE